MSDNMFDDAPSTSTQAKPTGRPYSQFSIPHKFTGLVWPAQHTFSAPKPPSEPDDDEDELASLEYVRALEAYEAELAEHDPRECWHDLQFRMCELTPREQDKAAKVSGESRSRLTRELIFAAIYQVGAWTKAGNRPKLEKWWRAIGPRCQRCVEAAFVAMNSVEEEDVKMFLDSAQHGVG